MYSKLNDVFFQPENPSQINQNTPSRHPDELKKMQGLLNSQRIQLLFGNFGVELLLQEGCLRVSNLNSNGLMRTCAVVNFSLPVPAWLQDTHNKICKGASIGQTIKDNKFDYTKEDAYLGITKLPEFAKEKMDTDDYRAAVHIYQFFVKNPETSEKIAYCTIAELHSPLYLTLGDLRQLYPAATPESAITETVLKRLNELSRLDELLSHSPNNSF